MKKIIIIICYFGKFPWYFHYFLHSCKCNLSIDFIIFTDNDFEYPLPENIYIKRISLSEIQKLVTKKLNIEVILQFPYKLCDFKPAYGVIFSEFIKGYDFWGHGDIDVIFGNIRKFITNELLDTFDLICVRHDFLTGYFTLFRNCKKMNELFKYSKDHEKVFSSPKHYCFDETNFAFEQFTEGLSQDKIKSEIESMTHVVRKLQNQKFINAHFDFCVIEGTPGKLKWENGTLTYRNKFEVLLYHLIKLKLIYNPSKPPRKIPNTFYISPTRIYT